MDIRRREAELFLLRYDGEETEAVRHLRNVLPILDAAENAAIETRNAFADWDASGAHARFEAPLGGMVMTSPKLSRRDLERLIVRLDADNKRIAGHTKVRFAAFVHHVHHGARKVLVIDEEDAAEAWPNGVPEVFEGARVAVSKRGVFGVTYGYRVKREAAE